MQLDMFPHQAWTHEAEQRGQKATERSFLTAAKRTLGLANLLLMKAHHQEKPEQTRHGWQCRKKKAENVPARLHLAVDHDDSPGGS